MGDWSNYVINKTLDFWFGGQAMTPPTNLYFGLVTTAPSDKAGTGLVEVSTGVWTNYARAAKTNNLTNFPAASAGAKENATDIDFGTATTSADVTVVGVAIFDASSSGNFLGYKAFTAPRIVQNTDPVKFPATAFDFTAS